MTGVVLTVSRKAPPLWYRSGSARISKQHDKAEEGKKLEGRKPPEYRRFEMLLKQVLKASPLRKATDSKLNTF
jgi:hypothetical protein